MCLSVQTAARNSFSTRFYKRLLRSLQKSNVGEVSWRDQTRRNKLVAGWPSPSGFSESKDVPGKGSEGRGHPPLSAPRSGPLTWHALRPVREAAFPSLPSQTREAGSVITEGVFRRAVRMALPAIANKKQFFTGRGSD